MAIQRPGRRRYLARLAVERAVRAAAWDALAVGISALHLAGGERLVYSVMDRPMWRRLVGRLVDAHLEGAWREREARSWGDPFRRIARRS